MGINKRPAISQRLKELIREKTAGRCWYCGDPIAEKPTYFAQRENIDHQQPYSRGGSNCLDNLVLACASCNSDKMGRTVDEFRSKLTNGFCEWLEEEMGTTLFCSGGYFPEVIAELKETATRCAYFVRERGLVFHGEINPERTHDYQI